MKIGGQTFNNINAIGLQNHGISGTVFIASLLDSHPNIAQLPGINTMGFYDFWEGHQSLNDHEKIAAFVEKSPNWFTEELSSMDGLGDNADQTAWADPNKFAEIAQTGLMNERPLTRREFFQLINISYNLANGRTLASDIYVIFHIHNMPVETIDKFYSDFPEAKVVYMIRNIKGNFASLCRQLLIEENGPPDNIWLCILNQLLRNKSHYIGNFDAFGDRPHRPEYAENCKAVRLEELHRHPRSSLKALCQWLGIPWDDVLLKSTYDGMLWWNKGRKASPIVQGFKPKLPYRGIDEHLSFVDQLRLDIISHRKTRFWRYRNSVSWLPAFARKFLLELLINKPLMLEKTHNNPPKEAFQEVRQHILETAEIVENEGNVEVPLLRPNVKI